MDIPLLYEAGDLVHFMHKIVVVRCEGPQQVDRLLARTKMTRAQAEQRVAAQMPLDSKAERADYVVDNAADLETTSRQVDKLVADLRRSRFHWKVLCVCFMDENTSESRTIPKKLVVILYLLKHNTYVFLSAVTSPVACKIIKCVK